MKKQPVKPLKNTAEVVSTVLNPRITNLGSLGIALVAAARKSK